VKQGKQSSQVASDSSGEDSDSSSESGSDVQSSDENSDLESEVSTILIHNLFSFTVSVELLITRHRLSPIQASVEPSPPSPKAPKKSITVEQVLNTGITTATADKATATPTTKARITKPKKGSKTASKPVAKVANTRGKKVRVSPCF
jgi:hypothetical protein